MTIPRIVYRKNQQSSLSYKADDIFARTHLVMMRAQNSGNFVFDGHKHTQEEDEIQLEAMGLADYILQILPTCKEEDILILAECFDNMYRLGYRHMPDTIFMTTLYRRAFKAWESGNKSIEESSIFAMIAPRIKILITK